MNITINFVKNTPCANRTMSSKGKIILLKLESKHRYHQSLTHYDKNDLIKAYVKPIGTTNLTPNHSTYEIISP